MKRKILMSLAVLAALTVSGVLLASSLESDNPCDGLLEPGCVYSYQKVCYFFIQRNSERAVDDRCFYYDYDFTDPI